MTAYGRRSMPGALHHCAQQYPRSTFALSARSDRPEDGFRAVTFRETAHAVDALAAWLLRQFPNLPRRSAIAYVGAVDLRYNLVFYAAVQCGMKVFLPSPRNPVAVNASLLEHIQCSRLVYSVELAPAAKALQDALPGLEAVQTPSLEELLAVPAPESALLYEDTFDEVCDEPVLVLHSSGSTGLPKPIEMTHGTFATYDVRDWPRVDGRVNHDVLTTLRFEQPESRLLDVFPPFHLAGFLMKVMTPVYNLTACIYGPSMRPPSGSLVADLIRLHRPRAAILPPTIAEQLYSDPDGRSLLKSLDVLLYAGGPLSNEVGTELVKHTQLCQFYGSTEIGQIHQLLPLPESWDYLELHPSEAYEMRPYQDGMFELVILANKATARTSSYYHNFPNRPEYHTKDLFEPHPTRPNLWKFATRTDDILVFSSGEKLNPIPMESFLTGVPGIRGALVVGQKQPRSVLLLELDPKHPFQNDPLEELQPSIQRGNALLPSHGRVAPSMIVLSSPERPFARAAKGTVVRRLTEKLYEAEIQAKFAERTMNGSRPRKDNSRLRPTVFQLTDVTAFLRSVFHSMSLGAVGEADNLYTLGMDSVMTIEAVACLKKDIAEYAPSSIDWIKSELIYRNPSISELSSILLDFLNKGVIPQRRDREREMQIRIDTCLSRIPPITACQPSQATVYHIAITGTTGFLGGHLIRSALADPRIGKIYCLNRSPTARKNFEAQSPHADATRLRFFQVDMSASQLGLDRAQYAELQRECRAVVHNAWRVDFNLPLPSFEDNVQSVERLIELCAARSLRLILISSISATGVWAPVGEARQTVPAAVSDDLASTLPIGYGESKQIAEQACQAASRAGLPVTIVRMGQIAPATKTHDTQAWPAGDIVPLFLQTCKALRFVPADFVERVDWVPVDSAADVVLEIVRGDLCDTVLHVYNVVHPHASAWTELVAAVQAWCGAGARTTTMHEWMQQLQREPDHASQSTVQRLPALRMLHMYELVTYHGPMHLYEMDNLLNISPATAAMPVIDAAQMEGWLQCLQ